MATNDSNKPDNVTYIDPGNKMPEEKDAPDLPQEAGGGEATAPEMTADEAAALAQEGEAGLRDIGEEQLEPPAPFDMGGEHIPDPGNSRRRGTIPGKERARRQAAQNGKGRKSAG